MEPSYDTDPLVATTPPVLLRPFGFWSQKKGDGLPDPKKLASATWELARRPHIASYLRAAPVLERWDTIHTCVLCGDKAGYRERTDGVWRWPEGLAHYVTAHGVQLPSELVAHMRHARYQPPAVDVAALRDALPAHDAPTNPQQTSLISNSSMAAQLDELLAAPQPKSLSGVFEDETATIPV
ncbi:MAG TPA: hypothetical protein VGO62_03585, partial [Myxococcota bacterium]